MSSVQRFNVMETIYKELPIDHVRLLYVQPGAHHRDLRFNFVCCTPGSIQYTAISYTWGNEPQSEMIEIDGQKLFVRPNLWACLHTIQNDWQYIWADAVCINQRDITEKNNQVRFMEHIYRNAAVVSVWLGQVSLPSHIHLEGPSVTVEVDDFDWRESMDDLASRPYWSRCWVIQEFLLAQDVRLYCSNTSVDYLYFQGLLSSTISFDLLSYESKDLARRNGEMTKWPALGLLIERHMDRYPEIHQSLHDLLVNHPDARSTDPRDRVFSLLGLLSQDERLMLQRNFPNYNLTEEQVMIVTLAHLKQYNMQQLDSRVFRAMRIEGMNDILEILQIVDRLDYIGSEDPAADVDFIARSLRVCPTASSALTMDAGLTAWFKEIDRDRARRSPERSSRCVCM